MGDELWESLADEAEDLDLSRAEYCRLLIREGSESNSLPPNTQSNTAPNTLPNTAPNTNAADLDQRVTDIEDRLESLDELEDRLEQVEERHQDPTPDPAGDTVVTVEDQPETAAASDTDDLGVPTNEYITGQIDRDLGTQTSDLLVCIVKYLAEEGPKTTAEIQDYGMEMYGDNYSSGRSMMETVRRYFGDLDGITKPGRGEYDYHPD